MKRKRSGCSVAQRTVNPSYSLIINKYKEDNLEVLNDFLESSIMQEILVAIERNPFLMQFNWKKEPNKAIIYAKDDEVFNTELWFECFGEEVEPEEVFSFSPEYISTSLHNLGCLILNINYKHDKALRDINLEILEGVINKYHAQCKLSHEVCFYVDPLSVKNNVKYTEMLNSIKQTQGQYL